VKCRNKKANKQRKIHRTPVFCGIANIKRHSVRDWEEFTCRCKQFDCQLSLFPFTLNFNAIGDLLLQLFLA
jgi:hypothetical protein